MKGQGRQILTIEHLIEFPRRSMNYEFCCYTHLKYKNNRVCTHLHSLLFKAVMYYVVLTARHEIAQLPLFHIFVHIILTTWSLFKTQNIKFHLFKQNRDYM